MGIPGPSGVAVRQGDQAATIVQLVQPMGSRSANMPGMYLPAALLLSLKGSASSDSGTGDNVFWLLALMGGIALVAGLIDFVQYAKRDGFPIPLIIYCHLLPMVAFVYLAPQIQEWLSSSDPGPGALEEIELEVSRWPLYISLLPLPLVVLVRVFRSKK